jgi:parvulin-like peptidyl-prolyl isomerase
VILALCLQVSLLGTPVYLGESPPPLRSARGILILDTSSSRQGGSGLDPEAALALANRLRERLLAGEDFEVLAREHSNHPNAARSAVLGSFARGMLEEPLDGFLFAAALGEISEPLRTPGAVHVLQRIETFAAARHILLRGAGEAVEARMADLWARLEGGADFRDLALAESEDADSAGGGGVLAIFERSDRPDPLEAAAFACEMDGIVGPVRSSQGMHLLQRVPVKELDPALRRHNWARFRGLWIAHGAEQAEGSSPRSRLEAEIILEEVRLRLEAGDAFASLAGELSDDAASRARSGDLGWVHRRSPGLQRHVESAFRLAPGARSDPIRLRDGILLLERSD